ncbi:YadA-like family protein [Acinetobacter venetianus]|uniref:YadA-like family protein n=1 Tax=Acinetobacter venetianus TaxID=52133 RepID=UPI00289F532D|nr:YadA-like family protein [Acinetobacter venetianus]
MNQLWNRCLHQKNCGDGNKECNKLYVPKLSILAVVLTATMTGNSAFALIEEDVNAPNSVQAPNVFADRVNANQRIDTKSLNITEFGGTTYTQLGVKNKRFSTTEKEGYIQTGYIKADEIQAGTLIATDGLTTKSLFVTEKLTASGASLKNIDAGSTNINHVIDAVRDDQAVNFKQLKEQDAQTLADAKIYIDDTTTTLRAEVTAETERLDQEIAKVTNGDAQTLADAKAYTDNTATTLRSEAATESARLDKAIVDGNTSTLANAKTYTDNTATTLRSEAATESARLDKAIADGNASTLASANKTTADMATAIRNEVKDTNAKTLADAKAHTNSIAATTLNNAKQYTDQSSLSVLEQAKAYTDANANGSPFVALQSNDGDELAKAEGMQSIAIGVGAVAQGEQSIAIGVGNQVTGNHSGAIGDPNVVSGNASYAVGNNNTVNGDNTFVLGNDINTNATNAVVLGNASTSDRDNTVSVGSVGGERQVIHVAAATADSDAVNLKQMNMADTATLVSAKMHTDNTATTLRHEAAVESTRVNKAIVDGDKATLASAKGYTDTRVATFDRSINQLNNRVNQLNTRVDDVERTAYRGIAIALAAQQAVPSIQPGQVAVFGGVGHYEGETAGSIGVVTSFTDRISASGALGFAGGNEFGGRVGVAYVFGGK